GGHLMVPLDSSHPTGRKISIALVRKPATGTPKVGPLLINHGGPGVSAITFLRDAATSYTNLNRHFDLVAFDPRGVASSTPVTCVDSPTLDNYLSIDSVLDDPQDKQTAIQPYKHFA